MDPGSGAALSSKFSPRKSRSRKAREYTVAEVKQALGSALTSGQDIVQVARQIFEDCQAESAEQCRKTVFVYCVDILNSDQLQRQVAKELVGKLLIEVDNLSGPSLVEVVEQLTEAVKKGSVHVGNGRSLELYPKLLSIIAVLTTIKYQKDGGGSGEMEGAEFKSHLLNSLCSCRWDSSSVLHVANVCREIPMSSDEIKFLMEKILRMMKSLAVTELPPLVYQLLVLSTKGHRALVLEGIISLFNQLDKEVLDGQQQEEEGDEVMAVGGASRDELLQTEGTAILHITFALKQDQELGKEFVKRLKAVQMRMSVNVLSAFSVALTLSVARIHRFQDHVFEFMKNIILKSFKDSDRRSASKWMQEVYPDLPDLEKLLLDTVTHSVCGWDHVVQGLVMLGFNLMDFFVPKSTSPSLSSPQHKACLLGSKILRQSFKAHSIVHEEVVSQLINRILTNASAYISHYIDLLSDILSSSPHMAQDSLPQFREVLSYLSLLPPRPAVDLLQAMLPLVQFSAALRDSLLLVLRKSLFSRQVETRRLAVGGYLLLLTKFKILESMGMSIEGSQASQASQITNSSQVLVEVHMSNDSSSSRASNEALCLEILGTFRRCFTQQYEVRVSLYEGLYQVFCSNPKLAEPIVDLLISQFQRYYESDADLTPPVKLEPCITACGNEITRTEPLDYLLHCLQLCVSKFFEWQQQGEEGGGGKEGVEGTGETPELLEEGRKALGSLVERMIKSEPEDFELDKSADFSTGSSVGQKNRIFARLVIGVYEAMLEYTFASGDMSQESCERMLKLYHGYQRVADILQEKAGSGVGAKRGPSSAPLSRTERSQLSLHCVTRLLRALFSDSMPSHQQPLVLLRESHLFVKYVLAVTLQKIHQVHENGTCDGALLYNTPEKIFKSCCSLGRVLFKRTEAAAGQGDAGKKEKGKSVHLLCLEGFYQLLQTVGYRYADNMETFLSFGDAGEVEMAERVQFFTRHFQRVVTGVLNGTVREWSMKDTQVMVAIIGLLAGELEPGSQHLDQVFEWTHSQCKDQNIDDIQVSKALVSLLLSLNARHTGSWKIYRRLSQDIHYHLGDSDEDVELECRTHFAIVNPRTAASTVLALLYAHMEQSLTDADWLLTRIKSESSSAAFEELFAAGSSSLASQAEGLYSDLCERMTHLVAACSELVQTAVSAGSATEGLVKTVTKLYTLLVNLVKYNAGVYSQFQCVAPSLRKLVDMVGTHLSQQLYCLITYIQTVQPPLGGEHQDKGKKAGGKSKSKGASSGKVLVRKETRSIPNLIFSMEQLEKFLIQLSKKSKINLMDKFKRSTSRDFRINHQAVDAVLNEDAIEEEEEEEGGAGDEATGHAEEERPPKAKKLKRS